MRPLVYLAGPITGLTYDEATDWRNLVTEQFGIVGIKAISPLRRKDYLAGVGKIASGDEYRHLSALSTTKGILTRDRFDAMRCDVLLVNLLGAIEVSKGTVMEIAYADAVRKPIVCAIEESGNVHEHAMVSEAISFRCATLEEAVHLTKAILR